MADSSPARIAVISTPDTADLAALVTTELSGNPNLALVERDAVSKIGDELKVQTLANSDAVALGKLVNADGLIFLIKEQDGRHLRFTAVGLGYALFDDQIPLAENPTQLAKSISHRVADYAPKLKIDPGKALPLSVLNIRADYSTPAATILERNLSLLLESRLSSIPEYVVLERRHAWSLGFDHSLDPKAPALLHGAYLIEGTLSLPPNSPGNCTIATRIHFPDGRQTDVTVQGNAANLSQLADQLLTVIQKKIGGATSAAQPNAAQEAQEYIREGLWGRHAHALAAGLEALDSAELLGANIPDVEVERIPILYALADEGMENWLPFFETEDKTPAFDGPTLDRHADAAIRALQEAARYQSEKMEGQVDPALLADPTEKFMARTGNLEAWTVYRASKVLFLLDRAKSPRADELRQALRPVTGFDPLHGQPGIAYTTNVNNDNSRSEFADNWAQSLAEELAYYRLICADKVMALPYATVGWTEDRFAERFFKTPEERKKAFVDFVNSLKDRPDSRITYCLLRAHSDDVAVSDAGYKDFLGELWNIRDELTTAKTDRPLFHNLYPLSDNVKVRNAAAGLPLLHYMFASPDIDVWSIGVLRMLWRPQGFSAADAPQLWTEYKACRDRLAVKWKAGGYGEGSWNEQMGGMADDFRSKFPDIAVATSNAASPEPDALVITKFWNPGQVSTSPKGNYLFASLGVCPDGLWVKGVFTKDDDPMAIYHVNLNTFTTEDTPPAPIKRSPSEIVCASDAIYIQINPKDNGGKNGLARFDLKTRSWQTRTLPDFRDARMFGVNDKLYLFVTSGDSPANRETSIVRYDWGADQWNILASNRRRPAHNQFDDSAPIVFFGGIFAGPDQKPCLNVLQGTYFIHEEDGPWPEVFDGTFGIYPRSIGDRTLLCEGTEAVMLDANASSPEYWVANSFPHARKPPVDGKPQEKVPTPWANKANWTFSTPDKQIPWGIGVGFHDETLFVMEKPNPGESFHLLCYQKGNNSPVRLPLQFHMDDATRAQLSFLPDTGSDSVRLSIDQLQHPEKVPMERMHIYPQLISTHQGLCMQYTLNGFWFLPFADIDNYLKTHSTDSAKPSTP